MTNKSESSGWIIRNIFGESNKTGFIEKPYQSLFSNKWRCYFLGGEGGQG